MLITTNSDQFTNIGVMALFPVTVDKFTPKNAYSEDGATQTPKLTEGKQQLRVPADVVRLDETGAAIGKEQNVSLAILSDPIELAPGVLYRLTGTIRVTPYQNDARRIAYSIVADGIAAVKTTKHD